MGFYMPQYTRMAISPQRMIRYTLCLVLGWGFQGRRDRMALFSVTSNPSWRQAAILDNFEWPYHRTAHSIHLYSNSIAFLYTELGSL